METSTVNEPAAVATTDTDSKTSDEQLREARLLTHGKEIRFMPEGTTTVHINGSPVMWLTGPVILDHPTKVSITAKMEIPEAMRDYYMKLAHVNANIKQQYLVSGKIQLQVEESSPGQPKIGTYVTYTGLKVSSHDWLQIVKHCKCDNCKDKIRAKDFLMTSINNLGKKNERVVCKKCVTKTFAKLGETQRANIVDRLGFNPLEAA